MGGEWMVRTLKRCGDALLSIIPCPNNGYDIFWIEESDAMEI
jgi:hypothetical protein